MNENTTLAEDRDDLSGPPPLFVLRITAGPDTGKSLVLDWNATPRVLVGKSAVCNLQLSDPRVSRRHFALSPRGHAVVLTDLGSTNGTGINGVRVIEAIVTGGESLEIGGTVLKVARAGNLPDGPRPRTRFGRVVGASQEMQRLFVLAEKLSASTLPVLVEGETGTGKALLAEAIHDASPRATNPFVIFDCGAFTGEEQIAALFGAVEQAHTGTLVLDEVGNLEGAAQLRLVAMVERGQVQRSNGEAPRAVDVRMISTSRRSLDTQVEEGSFREALLFRLTGARLEVPPLRMRHGDVDRLARHFWTLFDGPGDPPKSFLIGLQRHEWAGNVRELEHAVAQRLALGDEFEMRAPIATPKSEPGDSLDRILSMDLAMPHARQVVLDEFEERYVTRAVAAHGGNLSRAAAASGVTRRYFHKLKSKAKRA